MSLSTHSSGNPRWRSRLIIAALLIGTILALVSTRRIWVSSIGYSLVCTPDVAPSDLILIENFDPNYLLFERAAMLQNAGIAPRALVPVQSGRDAGTPNYVFQDIAEVMARHARVRTWETLPIRETEPISLNAALQIRDEVERRGVKSLLLVTTAFRSFRSWLVFRAVLSPRGIEVRCDPVFGRITAEDWPDTWHGVQDVVQEFLKLQYYRLYVLRFSHRADEGPA